MTTLVDPRPPTPPATHADAASHAAVRRKVAKLLRLLRGKSKILITTHVHPDPDAIGAVQSVLALLGALMPGAGVSIRLKGRVGGGINDCFTKSSQLVYEPWDDAALPQYDATVLVDTQPGFANCPLPSGFVPTAIVDHHRGRGRRAKAPFADIQTDVGASVSILFGYLQAARVPISPGLAATMLYAIESDLSGIAGHQAGQDTLAISALTLLADAKRLCRMRYVDLPPTYYAAFGESINHAVCYDDLIVSHIDHAPYAEMPGVMADFLLRCRGVHWTMVTAVHEGRFVFSLRTKTTEKSAGELARQISDGLGDGGGHLTKAGGAIVLPGPSAGDFDALHARLTRRLLRCMKIPAGHAAKLT